MPLSCSSLRTQGETRALLRAEGQPQRWPASLPTPGTFRKGAVSSFKGLAVGRAPQHTPLAGGVSSGLRPLYSRSLGSLGERQQVLPRPQCQALDCPRLSLRGRSGGSWSVSEMPGSISSWPGRRLPAALLSSRPLFPASPAGEGLGARSASHLSMAQRRACPGSSSGTFLTEGKNRGRWRWAPGNGSRWAPASPGADLKRGLGEPPGAGGGEAWRVGGLQAAGRGCSEGSCSRELEAAEPRGGQSPLHPF